jgi:hypothetical protein
MPWRRMREWKCSSTFLDLGAWWRWTFSLTLLPLYPQGKSPHDPLDRRRSGSQSRSWCCGEQKNRALQGIEPGPPSRCYADSKLPHFGTWCRDPTLSELLSLPRHKFMHPPVTLTNNFVKIGWKEGQESQACAGAVQPQLHLCYTDFTENTLHSCKDRQVNDVITCLEVW